jgi:hypothetical protein
MPKHRTDLTRGVPLPSTWVNAMMEHVGVLASNVRMDMPNNTTVRVVAGSGNDQAALAVEGKLRLATANVSAAHPGGSAGIYDLTAADPADATNYAFGAVIRARSGGAPSPPPASGATTHSRRIGIVLWDGAKITQLIKLVPVVSSAPVEFRGTNEPAGSPPAALTWATLDVVAPYDGARYKLSAAVTFLWQEGAGTDGIYMDLLLDGVSLMTSVYTSRVATDLAGTPLRDDNLSHHVVTGAMTAGLHTFTATLTPTAVTGFLLARIGRSLIAELVP